MWVAPKDLHSSQCPHRHLRPGSLASPLLAHVVLVRAPAPRAPAPPGGISPPTPMPASQPGQAPLPMCESQLRNHEAAQQLTRLAFILGQTLHSSAWAAQGTVPRKQAHNCQLVYSSRAITAGEGYGRVAGAASQALRRSINSENINEAEPGSSCLTGQAIQGVRQVLRSAFKSIHAFLSLALNPARHRLHVASNAGEGEGAGIVAGIAWKVLVKRAPFVSLHDR